MAASKTTYNDDFEPSQDVLQIVREHSARATKSSVEPPIKEEVEEEDSDQDGE